MQKFFQGLSAILLFSVFGETSEAKEGPGFSNPLPELMPRSGDFTSMWWAEGFPGRIEGAPWLRCIRTGSYGMILDTEAMKITQLGPVPTGIDYESFGRSPDPAWGEPAPADLSLNLTANGKTYRCSEGGKWTRFTGPRLIESGRFFQRADVTNLVFTAADGEKLNTEGRFETAAWSDRLALILSARPGLKPFVAGESSFGKAGGGFGLTGSNAFEIPHDPSIDTENFTLELWAFIPSDHSATKTSSPWLVCKNRNEDVDGNYGILIQRGKPQARINIGGGRKNQFSVVAEPKNDLKLNAWNHLAISYDGDSLRLYVNGKEAGSQKIGRKRTPGKDALVFGRRGDNSGDGYHFRGVIDEIRFHDQAAEARAIRQTYHLPGASRPNAQSWNFRADGVASETLPRDVWKNASMEMTLSTANGALSLQSRSDIPNDPTESSSAWHQVALALNPASFEEAPRTSPIQVEASEVAKGRARTVEYDPAIGWHRVNLDGIEPTPPPGTKGPSNDAIERVTLRLSNKSDREEIARLMFEKTPGGIRQRIGSSITGISAMLRDRDGNPTGIPVQLSKNWHNSPEGGVHSGLWFHGLTQLRLPPSCTTELELTISYGHWGGIPAASHAQLSLIGWGNNQLWHQSALGSWGESICYEPEQGQANCTITDVRPSMARSNENDPKWKWTGNMGGGDFFRFFDPAGNRVAHSAMKTTNVRHGPCLSEVTYSGRLGDGITHSSTVSLARTDDIVRGIYQLRLDVHEPTDFSRFAFFQVGADTYNFTRERKMALGNETGLIKEWDTQWGGDQDRGEPLVCTGNAPWISLHQKEINPASKHDVGANRGIVIRSWKARLGGKDASAWIVERGLKGGRGDSSNINIVPPPGVTRLEPGDFVEATFEHIVMPQFAKEYYGPSESLRAALSKDENTWRMIDREAKGNARTIEMKIGSLLHTHPDVRVAAENDQAEFTLSGGLGYVPVTISNLSASSIGTLLIDGNPFDQSIHGRDFWQTDFDPKTQRWSRTYNIPAPENTTHLIRFETQ